MSTSKETMTKVINGHMYEISDDKTQATPVALSLDAVNAAKTDPDHYLNKVLDLDPKTLEPIVKEESEKNDANKLSAKDKLRSLLDKSDNEPEKTENDGPTFG